MATVYLCTDLRNERPVAVKVLRPELGNAVTIERFMREIGFVSELKHPRIPEVLASGAIDKLPYYVMSYVNGESLRNRIRRDEQLPVGDAVEIARQVLEAMSYAHEHGILHRDIKPENILLADDGAHVLDFGVARAIIEAAGERLTATGVTIGTPAYMSPEQALGYHDLDNRSDIYAVGCVLYEMLTGAPPFAGPNPQIRLARRFSSSPEPIRQFRPDVPVSLERTLIKALAKEPDDRFRTGTEFGDALRESNA
jgi:serine/threonine-protein kinase